jgi:3-hydroxybutyryl-CoA dehydrogenase
MVVILAPGDLKEELLAQRPVSDDTVIQWITDPAGFLDHKNAEGYIDLGFDYSKERIDILKQLPAQPVIISAVAGTLSGLPSHFIRVNGWRSFLKRAMLEAAGTDNATREKTESIFTGLGKTVAWTPDVPGFISARVVAMVINEAYFSLLEGVSSREATDTAMKLGTNYPYGPFEWGNVIGIGHVAELLRLLSVDETRYQPCSLLEKEVPA